MTIKGRGARKGWTGIVLFSMGTSKRVVWTCDAQGKVINNGDKGEKCFLPLQSTKTKKPWLSSK